MDYHSLAHGGVAILTIALGCLTSSLSAATYSYSMDFNLPIPSPDEPESEYGRGQMQDAVFFVSEHLTVDDLDVMINITHSSVFDLQILLQSPTGKKLCLNKYDLDEFFSGQDYIQTIFDDEAVMSIEQAQPPFTGRFRPRSDNLLSIFDDQDTYGLWRICVYDGIYDNTGTLESAALLITNSVPEPSTVLFLALGSFFVRLTSFTRRQKAKSHC